MPVGRDLAMISTPGTLTPRVPTDFGFGPEGKGTTHQAISGESNLSVLSLTPGSPEDHGSQAKPIEDTLSPKKPPRFILFSVRNLTSQPPTNFERFLCDAKHRGPGGL